MTSLPDNHYDSLISRIRAEANGNLAWTPSKEITTAVVNDFLAHVEPEWLEATIRRDPALYKHMDLSPEDLKRFLGSKDQPPEAGIDVLTREGKITPEMVAEIANEVREYQGLHALAFHRIAHTLYERGMDKKDQSKQAQDPTQVQALRSAAAEDLLTARKISQGVRRLAAGIEIHPGATIGANFFIDHGSGIVIGETAEIGDNVQFYHNITLGAASGKEIDEGKRIPRRHPKIGNNVTISNNVNILGPVVVEDNVGIGTSVVIKHIKGDTPTTIGNGANIRDGATVTRNVDPGTHVIGTIGALPGMTNDLYGELVIRDASAQDKKSPFTMVDKGTIDRIGTVIKELVSPSRGSAA